MKHRIRLLALKDLKEGYYGPVKGVTINHFIYCRVSKAKAYLLDTAEAIAFVREAQAKGYPAICEPRIQVVY